MELIIRQGSLASLANVSAFTGTPLAAGVGYIYVPADLVSTYKSASNWSSRASQIKSIADYPLAFQNETITDSWDQILAAEQDGTYSTKYSVGDVKYIDIGGTKLPMQIVAMDTDELSAGGYAKITWISQCALCTAKMNPTDTTAGGWASSTLRNWLREVIYPQIETTVRNAIKPVTKTYKTTSATQSVTDTVWIPSVREMFGGSQNYVENAGCDYAAFFTANAARTKKVGQGASAVSPWWLRSASSETSFRFVGTSGSQSTNNGSAVMYGVVFGFCT